MPQLTRAFYNQPAVQVAQSLLGCKLVRLQNGQRLAGWIIETEAYQGEDDLGCHAHVGRTARTEIMYGQPGIAYVYFTYGMHWLFNTIVDAVGIPAGVLIRSILPCEGEAQMAVNRPHLAHQRGWVNGPAKLAQALALNGAHNGVDLCHTESDIFMETGCTIPPEAIQTSARIGLYSVPEPWKSIPWRFTMDEKHITR